MNHSIKDGLDLLTGHFNKLHLNQEDKGIW